MKRDRRAGESSRFPKSPPGFIVARTMKCKYRTITLIMNQFVLAHTHDLKTGEDEWIEEKMESSGAKGRRATMMKRVNEKIHVAIAKHTCKSIFGI